LRKARSCMDTRQLTSVKLSFEFRGMGFEHLLARHFV
jgi:hypothetical protein